MISRNSLSPEQLLALLEVAIRDAPPLAFREPLTDEEIRWLGKADALVEASGATNATISFRVARNALGSYSHDRSALLVALHTAYTSLELLVPAAAQGAFIPAGDTWNGYAAIVKLLQRSAKDLLLVDPYLASSLYTDFIPHVVAQSGIRCLTAKQSSNHMALFAASEKWNGDAISKKIQAEVRYAPNGSLHDRLIIIDDGEVWLISQSLKDIAVRSPASVSRAEAELGAMKSQHYNSLWKQSVPIS